MKCVFLISACSYITTSRSKPLNLFIVSNLRRVYTVAQQFGGTGNVSELLSLAAVCFVCHSVINYSGLCRWKKKKMKRKKKKNKKGVIFLLLP